MNFYAFVYEPNNLTYAEEMFRKQRCYLYLRTIKCTTELFFGHYLYHKRAQARTRARTQTQSNTRAYALWILCRQILLANRHLTHIVDSSGVQTSLNAYEAAPKPKLFIVACNVHNYVSRLNNENNDVTRLSHRATHGNSLC